MKQKTEIQLCKAFMDLMRKYPFTKITIQKIASECGVNRQTFYYHFDNIYDLMATAFEYELVNECHMYDEDSWEGVMERFLRWMKDNKVIIKNILTNIESRYLRQAMYPMIIRCMEDKYRPNVIVHHDTGIDNDFLHRFITYGLTQYIIEWAENDFKEGVKNMVSQFVLVLRKLYG